MQKYAISHVTFQRGAGRRLQKVRKASTNLALRVRIAQSVSTSTGRWKKVKDASAYRASFVVEDVAAVEVGRSAILNSDPAALHAKVCNQSRNVPAGRWKKAPEVQKRAPTVCVSKERNGSEFSGALKEGSRGFKSEHALHRAACQNSAKCQ